MVKINLVQIKKQEGKPWLFIDGIRHDKYFDHHSRVRFLETAIKSFDKDLEVTAERFKDHPYGSYLWVFTSDFFRGEETYSLIRYHYLEAMINQLLVLDLLKKIIVETWIPKNLRTFLKALKIKIAYKKTNFINSIILHSGGGFQRTLKIFLNNIGFLFKKGNHHHSGVIADINRSFTAHRYDSIENVIIKYPKIKFFSGQEHPLEGIEPQDQVVFRKELTPTIFIGSVFESIKVAHFVLTQKQFIPAGLYANLSAWFHLINWYDLIIFRRCVEKYLDNNKIEKIFHVSTLTKPTYRILMATARKRKVEFILIASRTLMHYRSSDRLLHCDVKEYNNTALPDKIIVKDEYSRQILMKTQGMDARIAIGGRFHSGEIHELQAEKPFALLLMFNHSAPLTHSLIEEVLRAGIPSMVKTIIFRCHPSHRLDTDEMKRFFPDNHLINITGANFQMLQQYFSITVSGATTGALDAVQAGTIILWVPYIWDDGILMDDIMCKIGINCENRELLAKHAKLYLSDKIAVLQKFTEDKEFLNENFRTENLISELI